MRSKPIDSLKASDIAAHPIWEFATDEEENEGQDETWVRPIDTPRVPMGAFSLSVAADFLTPAGLHLEGIVGVSTGDKIEMECGAIFHSEEYIFVPAADYRGAQLRYDKIAKILGLPRASVFPLKVTLRVCIDGEDFYRSCEFGNNARA